MRRHSVRTVPASAPDRDERSGAPALPLRLEMDDPRADGGKREIEILHDMIMVVRSVAGVRMRLALPITLFEGVALCTFPGSSRVAVRLVHEDVELCVDLFEAADDVDATAEWRYWTRRFGLPQLVGHADGTYAALLPRLGELIVGRPRARRRPSDFAGRRPRFLTRRRTGRLPERPIVHREREIIARD